MRSTSACVSRVLLLSGIALRDRRLRQEGGPPPLRPEPAASTAPEGQVDIIAWPGYIERGDTDAKYDWVKPFEAGSGCKVNVKTAGTSDEMVSLMNQGGYDLVTASGDASLRLIRGGTVQPIDVVARAVLRQHRSAYQGSAWHFVDGKHYGVPYQWGPNVLMYNTSVFKKAPTSWSVVFEPGKFPTASRARAACRRTTGRSTSPTRRCT
jgi:putative spermidine/putrescine transport system substrate-binding protein